MGRRTAANGTVPSLFSRPTHFSPIKRIAKRTADSRRSSSFNLEFNFICLENHFAHCQVQSHVRFGSRRDEPGHAESSPLLRAKQTCSALRTAFALLTDLMTTRADRLFIAEGRKRRHMQCHPSTAIISESSQCPHPRRLLTGPTVGAFDPAPSAASGLHATT